MHNGLLHAHSGLRWLLLILLVYAVFNAFSKWRFRKNYTTADKLVNLFTMILFHIQLVIGLVLYIISNKVQFNSATMENTQLRFFTVEHALMMIAAVALVTIGRRRSESTDNVTVKHRRILFWYGLALFLTLVSIPWPFRPDLGANWF